MLQASHAYRYHYAYRPRVVIFSDGTGRARMKVDGVDETLPVVRLK
jgi:hypothetical protein